MNWMTVVFWASRQKSRFFERSSSSSLLEKVFLCVWAIAARISAFAMLILVLGAIGHCRFEIAVFISIYTVSNAITIECHYDPLSRLFPWLVLVLNCSNHRANNPLGLVYC